MYLKIIVLVNDLLRDGKNLEGEKIFLTSKIVQILLPN